MGLEGIMFNPYEQNNIAYVVDTIEAYLNQTQPETVLEELAKKSYFDYSTGWSKVFSELFAKYSLASIVPDHYRSIVVEHRSDVVPQYTYFITSLISSKLLSVEILSHDIVSEITNHDAKYILFSFLASWDLQKALELDSKFTNENFGHIVQATKAPINDLILGSDNDTWYNIARSLLQDSKVQYHFYQTVQRIIKSQQRDKLDRLELFINRCCSDEDEHVTDFVCDLLELTSVRSFLENRWNISLTEKLYRNFSRNRNKTEKTRKMSITALNRLKGRLQPNFAVAARHQINRLNSADKEFIINTVAKFSSSPITDFSDPLGIAQGYNWEWKDCAYALVKAYKDKYPDREAIDVVQLATDIGVEIVFKQLQTEDFDACLVRDATLKSPVVIINTSKKSSGRINFSIAHEIAHAVIPHHADRSFICFIDDVTESSRVVMNKHLEREANSFAAYVLLPEKWFKNDISKLDYTMKNVKSLSEKYRASLVLVAKRWVEQSNLEIAMVFSTKGTIDWACTSDTFPFRWVDYIHTQSSVFKVIGSDQRKAVTQRVRSTNWFNSEYPTYTILEESYRIFDDKVLTLLQIVDEE